VFPNVYQTIFFNLISRHEYGLTFKISDVLSYNLFLLMHCQLTFYWQWMCLLLFASPVYAPTQLLDKKNASQMAHVC